MSRRVMLNVIVDLDNTPGVFHTEESARASVEAMLLSRIGHYNPVVFVAAEEEEPETVTDEAWAKKQFAEVIKDVCPTCSKAAGELCSTPGVWVHLQRILLSERKALLNNPTT